MSYISKQSGNNAGYSQSVGTNFISTDGSTIPLSPASLVSGTTYNIATTQLSLGYWMISVQFDITGDATTSFEAIQINVRNTQGIILYDNWLVGTTLKSGAQIELNGTYPVFVYINPTTDSGNVSVQIIPTFTGTAPKVTSALIKPFKMY